MPNNEVEEEWYFSVVDVVGVLTESDNPQIYWRVLKKRLKDEGNESVTNCNALKMKRANGVMSVLLFFIRNNSTHLHILINISKNIWTNEVDYGKICIGEQPG